MSELEKEQAESREYNDLDRYRKMLTGARIKSVDFCTMGDEGLMIICDNGSVLYFMFSGSEGTIMVNNK